MKVLALDISTKTGWALFDTDGEGPLTSSLKEYGTIVLPKKISEWGEYPWSYLTATEWVAQRMLDLVWKTKPDVIVIEETNKARSRYSQKALEYIHCNLLYRLVDESSKVSYVSSSEWRSKLGLVMSKADKVANKKLNVAKKLAEATDKKLNKAALGIKGKVTKKHIAIRFVNEAFGKDFKVKHNDICDAICLGLAYLKGAKICDGK